MENYLKQGERIDDLQIRELKIIQNPRKFCFGIDAVLLANFATIKKGDVVVDMGTGTGIIPILIAGKTNASGIVGLEIQSDMAEMAARSVEMNGIEDRVKIVHGDIKKIGEYIKSNSVDIVVSNPPYMNSGDGLINPDSSKAVARHEIMCTLEDVISSAVKVLKNGGRMAMIHRTNRLADVLYAMRDKGIEPKVLRMIYPAMDKASNLFLVEGVKSGGRFLKVSKPLVIYGDDGNYTEEVYNIYYKGERM